MKDSVLLLSSFIKNPKDTGAVAPSSRLLTREITRNIDFRASRCIVELGPGVGTFTMSILRNAMPHTKLFCFEVNKKFCVYIANKIRDERLTIINAGAEELSLHLKKLKVEKADCIVSGLPFLNFPYSKKRKILNEAKNCLNDNGKFILFQYTNGLSRLLELYFSKVKKKFVAFNLPPSFVYICEK